MNPEHNCCYIAWGGEEHSKEEYDVSNIPRAGHTDFGIGGLVWGGGFRI